MGSPTIIRYRETKKGFEVLISFVTREGVDVYFQRYMKFLSHGVGNITYLEDSRYFSDEAAAIEFFTTQRQE